MMDERQACALLKDRFEAAGFHIEENVIFDEDGVRFDIDGFDADARVGYEYLTDEAGDGWDVDTAVKAKLEVRRKKGEVFIFIVDEAAAPDEKTLIKLTEAFLSNVKPSGNKPSKPAAAAPAKKPPAKRPAAKKTARR
jgi:hypothetical protein